MTVRQPKPGPLPAPVYAHLYPGLATVAREHGYALAVHGSLARDLDLVAVPWVDEAGDPNALVEALADHLQTYRHANDPVQRPFGRLTWALPIMGHAFVDVSVVPRGAPVPRDVLASLRDENATLRAQLARALARLRERDLEAPNDGGVQA